MTEAVAATQSGNPARDGSAGIQQPSKDTNPAGMTTSCGNGSLGIGDEATRTAAERKIVDKRVRDGKEVGQETVPRTYHASAAVVCDVDFAKACDPVDQNVDDKVDRTSTSCVSHIGGYISSQTASEPASGITSGCPFSKHSPDVASKSDFISLDTNEENKQDSLPNDISGDGFTVPVATTTATATTSDDDADDDDDVADADDAGIDLDGSVSAPTVRRVVSLNASAAGSVGAATGEMESASNASGRGFNGWSGGGHNYCPSSSYSGIPHQPKLVGMRPDGYDKNLPLAMHPASADSLVEKIRAILCHGSAEAIWDRSALNRHNLFTQLDVLCHFDDETVAWKETARWLKYEEKLEVGGRWSKPHVSTASLHALLEVHRAVKDHTCVVDLNVVCSSGSLKGVAEAVSEAIVQDRCLDDTTANHIRDILLQPHKHKHRHGNRKKKPKRRTAETWKLGGDSEGGRMDQPRPSTHRRKSLVRRDGKDYWAIYTTYQHGVKPDDLKPYQPNKKLMKKIPIGAEAASILIGQVEFLDEPIMAFCRLENAVIIESLSEVALPTRFILLALGPLRGTPIAEYCELGRAMAALLNDRVFCAVSYKALSRQDIIDGIDEYLDDLTVLPPSIWDPNTRLEPPTKTRSMDKIWKRLNEANRHSEPQDAANHHEEENDETLKRTGRIFGGLLLDVRRCYRHYASDFVDGLHLQCVASIVFLYFACITPIVTFGGLMGRKTDNYMGTMETMMSGAICGVLYALFAGQPLNIIGATGPLLVFESVLYHLCKENDIEFLSFRFWIGVWVFVYLMLLVAFDLSALVRYITRFTEESFAVLISVIFIYEAFSKILEIWESHPVHTNAVQNLADFQCFCIPPHTNNLTHPNETAPLLRMADVAAEIQSEQSPDVVSSVLTPNNIMFAAFNVSWLLAENCLTYRRRVVVHSRCISEAMCLGAGWTLEGSSCYHRVTRSVPDVFLLSCLLFFGTFSVAMFLRTLRTSRYFPSQVRTLLGDFAVFLSIVTWTAVDSFFGLDTPKLDVPNQFKPTLASRGWFVDPSLITAWWLILVAAVPGLLATILVFLDQQITTVIVNRKENKLKKGHGYHLDLFVLAFLIGVCSVLGLPWFVAATVRAITHVRSLIRESEVRAPGERAQMLGVREQRVTGVCIHLLIGFSTLLTSVLKLIPMPVLYGVFLYMGITSLGGVQFIERVLIMFMPIKYQPDYIYLRHVQTSRVHYFTLIQIGCSALMWIIKSIRATSIAFPVMLVALVLTRKMMDFLFTQRDLYWLDHLLPDETRRKREDLLRAIEDGNKFNELAANHGQTPDIVLTPCKDTDDQDGGCRDKTIPQREPRVATFGLPSA